ncbi:MAG TPA: serine hydrolase [Pyrinomonadaceae bacterium]|nr:serine hydrolase [Pyrinomonadaceae bacterium]
MKKPLLTLLTTFSLLFGAGVGHPQHRHKTAAGKRQRGLSHRSAALPVARNIEDRIRRVEEGLLLPAVLKGAPPVRLKLADRMRYYNTQGVSIAVINDGKIEWARGYGLKEAGRSDPVTAETLFSAGSISKPVAAMAALKFVENGRLDLDEDVNNRLVSWKVPENEYTKRSKVTLRRLLNHTSGLPLGAGSGRTHRFGDPFPTLVQALSGTPPAEGQPVQAEFEPNCRWAYSSAGYAVMQLLLMDVAKKSFPELMRETLFDKLGMTQSTFENPLPPQFWARTATGHGSTDARPIENRFPSTPAMAASGLWTTPTDLARFILGLQKAKAGQPGTVLSQETADLMLTPFRAGWSLGLEVNTAGRTPRFSHSGGMPGFTALMVGYNWHGQGAVVMVNQDTYNGFQLVTEIMLAIAREYDWIDYRPVEKTVARVNPELYEKYVGYYEIDRGYPVTVVTRNNRLYLIWALGNVYEMYPESETKFFIARDGVPTYTFLKDEQGRVVGVQRDWNGGTSTAKRESLPTPALSGNTTFRLKGHADALTVALAGTFNNWNSRQRLCVREGAEWVCRIDLAPGRYAYQFVVDNRWMLDPANPSKETDAGRNVNSVVVVGAR